ncbi:hypothetical protein [Sinomonas sp. ASV322]|uniref:hypothetical protein n=1 Tax=Sinomonas sp. ASV322 TaxID=3041920 RepID=UPI0027DB1B16|nr:hypothetical protein [Sinomonas sp. ASV322]MDQ4501250.1 hypothetical protein [Sinomonas sp. ASV322]
MPPSLGRLARSAFRARLALALAVACLAAPLALLAPAGGAVAFPGAPPSSFAAASQTAASPTTASPQAPQPGPVIGSASPGPVETPPAAPQAPGEPFPWAFVVFGVLGVALLVVWAVLTRRDRGSQ